MDGRKVIAAFCNFSNTPKNKGRQIMWIIRWPILLFKPFFSVQFINHVFINAAFQLNDCELNKCERKPLSSVRRVCSSICQVDWGMSRNIAARIADLQILGTTAGQSVTVLSVLLGYGGAAFWQCPYLRSLLHYILQKVFVAAWENSLDWRHTYMPVTVNWCVWEPTKVDLCTYAWPHLEITVCT
jgi:hypothetical protein